MYLEQDKEKKMKTKKIEVASFEEFLEMIGLGTDNSQDSEVEEKESEKESEMNETIGNKIERIISDFIECKNAMQVSFEGMGADYHQGIRLDIGRNLTEEEIRLVDIAFQYAFISGWEEHKRKGGNNDK